MDTLRAVVVFDYRYEHAEDAHAGSQADIVAGPGEVPGDRMGCRNCGLHRLLDSNAQIIIRFSYLSSSGISPVSGW
jgi:hypothetical protein